MQEIEATGKKFVKEDYLEARNLCLKAVDEIFKKLEAGMTEKDGHLLIEEVLKSFGSKKRWHPNKFRIENNTIKSFREISDADPKLRSGDILFIDIGPVFGDHEADLGRTIIFGESSNPEKLKLAKASEEIFFELESLWKTENLTGEALYKKAEELSSARGYDFNPLMAGHRLGDFPHALISRDKLSDFNYQPVDLLWVLEVHIRCPKTNFGSFYEDILAK